MSEQPGEQQYGVMGPYPGAQGAVYKMITVFGPMIIMICALAYFIFTSESNHRADLQDAAQSCQIRVSAQREASDNRLEDLRNAANGRLNTYITTSEKRFELQRHSEVTMNNIYTASLAKIGANLSRVIAELEVIASKAVIMTDDRKQRLSSLFDALNLPNRAEIEVAPSKVPPLTPRGKP